jgi:hypothetical protein
MPKNVLVRLVADRDFKDDCRAGTGVVWRGKGDVQSYPAEHWPKLAAHPDVWELVFEEGEVPPANITPLEERRAAAVAEALRVSQLSELRASGLDPDIQVQEIPPLGRPADGEGSDTRLPPGLNATQDFPPGNGMSTEERRLAGYNVLKNAGDGVQTFEAGADFADTFDYEALTREEQDKLSIDELRALAESLDYGLPSKGSEAAIREEFALVTEQRRIDVHEAYHEDEDGGEAAEKRAEALRGQEEAQRRMLEEKERAPDTTELKLVHDREAAEKADMKESAADAQADGRSIQQKDENAEAVKLQQSEANKLASTPDQLARQGKHDEVPAPNPDPAKPVDQKAELPKDDEAEAAAALKKSQDDAKAVGRTETKGEKPGAKGATKGKSKGN